MQPYTLSYAPGDAVLLLARPGALCAPVTATLAEVLSLAPSDRLGARVNVLTVAGQRHRVSELQLVHAGLCEPCSELRRLPAQLVGGQVVCPRCRHPVDTAPPAELLSLPALPSARFFAVALRRAWLAGCSYGQALTYARELSPPPPPAVELPALIALAPPAAARRAA
jgi:hypothetical protein